MVCTEILTVLVSSSPHGHLSSPSCCACFFTFFSPPLLLSSFFLIFLIFHLYLVLVFIVSDAKFCFSLIDCRVSYILFFEFDSSWPCFMSDVTRETLPRVI